MSTHLEAHRTITDELAAAYRERATLKGDDLRNRAEMFWRLNDGSRNITQIRTELDMHATDLTIELITLDGEIEALKAQLNTLAVELQHKADWSNG